MKNVLRAAILTVMMGAATMAAQAQVRVFFGIGTPGPVAVPAYAPPCPGANYIWAPGYYYGQVWVPGRWMDRDDYYRRGYYGYDRDHYYARGDWDHRDWDHRDWDHRDGDRGDWGHGDRGRGWGHDHGHGWGRH
ncbi:MULTISPECIES: hypothetical protein [Acidobacterium]|uniref:Lipoprotein n=2 Tax=Acidobacterium capsulatum TaxID=33075 RepID=C1F456_ACIC5|nr:MULTISPECIES: hypothetical protein [Acidobacterium]ACO32960.1 hypothetical protein ACP_1084 [Acidobacterium capsulatum ATCC 51196]HCT60313.1 hypothetical protein [Acidobacterium sp.]